ncbi:MAG: hypothetical protein V4550_21340 [Gemmatimonadota bacterium]
MFGRTIRAMSLVLVAAAPAAAQAKHEDHDVKVAGGALPGGWMGRTDDASTKVSDTKFVVEGKGFHATTGPAAIYWSNTGKVAGPFTASVTMKQTKAPTHPEAYGLVFTGSKLDAADQSYFYFLVRGDGQFLMNHRAGAEVHKIQAWTPNAAIKKQDANGVAVNTLTVDASKPDSLRLKVNGVQVLALPAANVGNTDGLVGFRVNHNLDLAISDFVVTKK